ncbi:tRNA (5-methylaminomethyl-2-thiouridine)(34)-methyltransferase MnmD [Turneriella parva]|uniref:MnmC-like methyltransferase domain-containing protein n=1 Tax=Turneriella parva (strain ATCC BAA-1111 / DSM 21527 / NCTC 11395 / H) TaxID=869212 RepID=I4B4H2_TURPD|nr:tRNA (5-methylaminomethyl-2-thiouridine)(34)-methyltransferase MnmD [Turneriella parva]AFM12179.1 protein of unknown function DUF752 [Turneriella parva DSM 21527]
MTQFLSEKYDDIYFSQADPEAEKQFVFIEANRIKDRISAADDFVVAELGFGFGLNYALTRHAARQVQSLHKLHYFSVEEDFPEEASVRALAEKLSICQAEFTTPPQGGEVHHGDVLAFLEKATFAADVWYFDGFAPAKNPAMWSEAVFARAFALTKPLGTFSTYSAAGWVRRNLQNAGFVVEKAAGFGGKREMLLGYKP